MRTPAVFLRSLPVLAAASLLLSGCGGPAPAGAGPDPAAAGYPTDTTTAPDGGAAGSPSGFPFTVDNCGTKVTVSAPPERVVTIKSTSTELLLALGLGDRIVGTAFADGPVPEQWRQDLPVISEQLPAREPVLALEPDFVYAGWESNFSADGAGERASLGKLGINTYVSPAACREPGYQPDPLTFDGLFADIQEAGRIFGAGARADRLVAEQRRQLDAVVPDGKGLSALWYSSGSDTPYVGGGTGAPQLVMEAAGLRNIAADVDQAWSPLSWEAVADRNPDVIVLVDSSWSSVKKKIGVLEQHPVISRLDAVKEGRYLVVPFAASEAGIRSVETVQSLADQLAKLEAP
ncbi:putative F420-0 ABC transporter substrate-binding protein [Arthrobacter mangrovi]|uniref:ABC transporter substrate-binding protein n=1 Tax=Arthrobacter mangrovi TaxID=2966350 RepID=A0ABQ5MQA3_9MICC|nr:putative F420-0 ABC transporter substrate-binding protein [Arthrobacter mangrovi]GLB65890.1 ABC transporter substrate-binding protein [Arthrobacter mangrovi]